MKRREVAAYLGVSVHIVRALEAANRLHPLIVRPKAYRMFRRDEVEREYKRRVREGLKVKARRAHAAAVAYLAGIGEGLLA